MTPLLTPEELAARRPSGSLPLASDGVSLDTARILLALEDATGIIVAQLPWLIDGTTGELVSPLPPQFAAAAKSFCADIAVHKLTDAVGSSEDEREWFKNTTALLAKIDAEHQGSLSGPGYQESCIVIPDEDENIPDMRFVKKGRLF
jgi:hypothetical protein